ncbi:DUF3168 domain-containing protein [Pseudescherichia sp.]|uniref:tail completion protein gp17 n=1 Tax=Pseudescherichia sp. TaxID=2055881 RepID=UPI00289E9CDA|nr:DUF3168 domain-containing protein [Pseudescherichia sp.]
MLAPIFTVCAASPAVRALLGRDTLRLYPFGLPDDVLYPCAVWQTIAGTPKAYLAQRPDADAFTLQIDAWADTAEDATAVSAALRDAIEPHAAVTRWGAQAKDSTTNRYRYSFEVNWVVKR